MDNTLIIYITGDNGASANGGPTGRFNTFYTFNQLPETLEVPAQAPRRIRRTALRHDAADWLGDRATTRRSLMRRAIRNYGGTTNGAVIHWPKAIKAKGEIRPQYHHLIDIAPTVLEAAGLPQPKIVNGTPQKPIEGVSMVYSFNDAQAKSRAHRPVRRVHGQPRHLQGRLVRHDPAQGAVGAKAAPLSTEDKWELYNTAEDFSCAIDLAAQVSRQAEGVAGSLSEGGGQIQRAAARRPRLGAIQSRRRRTSRSWAGRTSLTVYAGMVGMKENAFIDVKNRAPTRSLPTSISASGASGVILAQGGVHSGWSLTSRTAGPSSPTTSWAP